MLSTGYQESVVRSIHREVAARKREYVAKYGEAFRDVIIASYHRHGRNRVGFTCEFGPRATSGYTAGYTVVDFAKRAFGSGKLRLIDRDALGERYAVLATEGEATAPCVGRWPWSMTFFIKRSMTFATSSRRSLRQSLMKLDTEEPTLLAMAERLQRIARENEVDGQPLEAYLALLTDCGFNMRDALQKIASGCMVGDD